MSTWYPTGEQDVLSVLDGNLRSNSKTIHQCITIERLRVGKYGSFSGV